MHNPNDVIAELTSTSRAYWTRAHADGPSHPDYEYNASQATDFGLAATFLAATVSRAAERTAAASAPMFEAA